MTEEVPAQGPVERPSLGCRNCGASMPLTRTVILGNHERMLQCPSCGAITRWSLSAVSDLDLRETVDLEEPVDLRDETVIELDLQGTEPHTNGQSFTP
jgi:uncharacterized Zn finger protein